jgi:hypothetical protein
MSLVLQSSGGGSVTVQEPTTASNFTATLPAATGTVVLTGTTPTLNGITFPATQVPSADANTLDDYEEGTWTSVISAASNPTVTYTKQGGTYVKVGKNVLVTCDVRWSALSGGSGNLNVSGLPFASSSSYATGVVGEKSGANLGASGNILIMENNLNAASMVFLETKQSSSSSGYSVTSLSGSGYLIFAFAYISTD